MTVDELKSMPKGQFIVMKTGSHPMISPLKLFFKWGISFEEPYCLEDKGARTVTYMQKEALMRKTELKYPIKKIEAPEDQAVSFESFEDMLRKRLPKTGGA